MNAIVATEVQELIAAQEPLYRKFDRAEADIIERFAPVELPIHHHFIQSPHLKMYIREIFMPKGVVLTSRIHKEAAPFTIARGEVLVGDSHGITHIKAPFHGVNEPGVKRLIETLEDTVWVAFYVTDKTDVAEIAKDIIFERDNDLLTDEDKRRWVDLTKGVLLP
jgi:hypothetical protein